MSALVAVRLARALERRDILRAPSLELARYAAHQLVLEAFHVGRYAAGGRREARVQHDPST